MLPSSVDGKDDSDNSVDLLTHHGFVDNTSGDEVSHSPLLLKSIRQKHPNKIIIGHLNVNSIRNKFVPLQSMFQNTLDIFLVSETKLDDTFTSAQFCVQGYQNPFRRDRTANGGGLLFYVSDNIICKQLNVDIPTDIEAIFLEINLRSQKWLCVGAYRAPNQNISYFFESINKCLLNLKVDNKILLGDLNVDMKNNFMEQFCNENNIETLIFQPTCFKSPENPTTIDHILVNCKEQFIKTSVLETGLSDFHKLTLTVLNKSPPKRKTSSISKLC